MSNLSAAGTAIAPQIVAPHGAENPRPSTPFIQISRSVPTGFVSFAALIALMLLTASCSGPPVDRPTETFTTMTALGPVLMEVHGSGLGTGADTIRLVQASFPNMRQDSSSEVTVAGTTSMRPRIAWYISTRSGRRQQTYIRADLVEGEVRVRSVFRIAPELDSLTGAEARRLLSGLMDRLVEASRA